MLYASARLKRMEENNQFEHSSRCNLGQELRLGSEADEPDGGKTMESQPLVVREREAARLLGISIAGLRRWRAERRGPPFVKIERCVAYRVRDLEAFLAEHLCSAKSAASPRPRRSQ